ncbi:Pectinesterase QRT1 [Platanthera zijinensis]|uniref:Pectinesterase n=1 Tax=Platanthera zijinensis TaxID=2320716 RepID=A0AAP0B4H1_9ASPA
MTKLLLHYEVSNCGVSEVDTSNPGRGKAVIMEEDKPKDMIGKGDFSIIVLLKLLNQSLYMRSVAHFEQNKAPAAEAGASGMQAMALRLAGDKTFIYQSRILGSQDTLFDQIGKHYFYQCYIQGSIDFIFGNARQEFGDPSMFNGDMDKRTKKTINMLSVAAAAIGNCEVEISEYLTHVPNISRTKFEKGKQIFHRP